MCWIGDPLYVVKIVIGPIICFILLLLVSVTGFVMFKKKYAYMTLIFFHRVLNYIHCRVKCVLVSLFFSQTQGPSGHIYASSNPEYLSANDGEKKKKIQPFVLCVFTNRLILDNLIIFQEIIRWVLFNMNIIFYSNSSSLRIRNAHSWQWGTVSWTSNQTTTVDFHHVNI